MKERKWRIKTTVLALSVSIMLSGCAFGSAGEEPSSAADKKEETRIAHVKTKEFKASHPVIEKKTVLLIINRKNLPGRPAGFLMLFW
ncbi:hypothetical protein AFK74_04415 [Bacillus amyloliquefaciens]|nr:hypothetical protein AFK74_04415 [Bacillus amyloliquefaciens]